MQRNGLVTTLESQCCQPGKEGDKNQHFSKVNKQALGGRRPEADGQNGRQPIQQSDQGQGPLLTSTACEMGGRGRVSQK